MTHCIAFPPVGGYPSEQNIIKIVRIEIFVSDRTDKAVIAALKVTYKVRGNPDTVTVLHGVETQYVSGALVVAGRITNNECDLSDFSLENELLVGATGKLKNLIIDPARNGRLAFIEFALYNRDTGRTEIRGQ